MACNVSPLPFRTGGNSGRSAALTTAADFWDWMTSRANPLR